jgi:hypothetical protein
MVIDVPIVSVEPDGRGRLSETDLRNTVATLHRSG